MTTLYIYKTESREVVAKITGDSNAACESAAADNYDDTDTFGWTYTPAFGATDGLIDTANAEEIAA